MNIDPAGNQPVRQPVPDVSSRPVTQGTPPPARSPTAGVPGRLAEVLRQAGADVSAAKLLALAAELESLGFPLARITPETAVQALFLSNNSVQLSPELLAEWNGEGDSVFRRVEKLRDAARALLADRRVAGGVRAAVAALVRDLDALAGAEPGAPLTGPALQSVLEAAIPAAGFPMNRLDDLAAVLLAAGGTAQASALAESIGSLLRRSGMMFEWRLLAWYRAGAAPGRLFELIHGDLKGALLGFLAEMEPYRGKGRLPTNLKSLEENARSLLDRITGGQISHLIDNSGERRSLSLQIPFGVVPERLYAGVGIEGRREPERNRFDTEHYSLAFEIETTNLGTVRAHLVFSGETVSATFYLRDREAKELAEGMTGEFRAFLEGRGYETGSIRFGIARDDSDSGSPGGMSRRSVDVRG